MDPPQPTHAFWWDIFNELFELDHIDEINQLYVRYATLLDSSDQMPNAQCRIAYFANMRYLQTNKVSAEQAGALLDQALFVLGPRENWGFVLTDVNGNEATWELIGLNAKYGRVETAVDLIEQLAAFQADSAADWPAHRLYEALCNKKPQLIQTVSDLVLFDREVPCPVSLTSVLHMVNVWTN
jgi:hypothetical protein